MLRRSPALVALLCGLSLVSACGAASSQGEPPVTDPLQTVSGEELYERAVRLAQQEDYVRAEQYLAAAMQRGFDEHRAMPLLLSACVRSSRLSAALGYAEPYLDRHPDAWSLRLLVATIHMGLGAAPAAQAQLERVTEDHPTDPTAHYMLGVIARDELRDPVAAEASFRRYLELAPEGEHAREARALVVRQEFETSGGAAGRPQRLPSEPAEDDRGASNAQEARP